MSTAGDPGTFQELLDCVTVQETGFVVGPATAAEMAAAGEVAARRAYAADELAGVLRAKLGRP